jgi:type II secretory pathway pseudopilin PulG
MGQTQILFIVLSVIIVGIAVAVGITQFNQSAVESNRNALLLDCQNIIASAQQWYRKPGSLGGGGGSFTGLATLTQIGVDTSNANGTFVLDDGVTDGDVIKIDATGTERDEAGNFLAVSMTYDASTGVTTTDTGI